MIFGAILAGGVGSRMNIQDMPKQFLTLGDKPILVHTLEKFALCADIDEIYIGAHPNWIQHTKDLVKKYVPDSSARIHVVSGGTDRNETIIHIIEAIEKDHGQNGDDIVVTHDSVRPFVTLRIIKDNIEAAKQYGACDTVVPAADTIVVSGNGEEISDIPERNKMYQGQTPQTFQIALLKKLYNTLTEEEKSVLTDACKICTVRNTPVRLVRGEGSNFKITTISDYKIANAIIGGKIID